MGDARDRQTSYAALEWRYDGPIPEPLRQIARYGSAERRLLIEAEAQADFFGALVRGQIEAIRRARREGAIPGRLLDDLKLYRRQEFQWRREARRLRDAPAAATRSEADAP